MYLAALNLLLNAIESLPETGGAITIQTFNKNETELQVSITDNGRGILPDDKDKIFIPFYSKNPDSIGLGLAISQKIIQAHQGTIQYESTTAHKTTFSFNLPIIHKSDIEKAIPTNLLHVTNSHAKLNKVSTT